MVISNICVCQHKIDPNITKSGRKSIMKKEEKDRERKNVKATHDASLVAKL